MDAPKNKAPEIALRGFELVGATGFEPATPTPPVWCATRLRYAPSERCVNEGEGSGILVHELKDASAGEKIFRGGLSAAFLSRVGG